MKNRFLPVIAFGLALGVAYAQDAPPAPSGGQPPAQGQGGWQGQGQRGGRGGGMGMGGGRGVMGTVTAVTSDHYTIKNEAGETYTVHFSANTRIVKQSAERRGGGGEGRGGGNPPLVIKSTDIKVGDAIGAMGEVDPATKSVGAMVVALIDPERAKEMLAQQANYGKTWIGGKVTAINELKVTLLGPENVAHSFVADESTTFRKRREPITLADLQVGDMVRVEGSVKGGAFVATTVTVNGMPQGDAPRVPRGNQAGAEPM